jgi:hypothetical protein
VAGFEREEEWVRHRDAVVESLVREHAATTGELGRLPVRTVDDLKCCAEGAMETWRLVLRVIRGDDEPVSDEDTENIRIRFMDAMRVVARRAHVDHVSRHGSSDPVAMAKLLSGGVAVPELVRERLPENATLASLRDVFKKFATKCGFSINDVLAAMDELTGRRAWQEGTAASNAARDLDRQRRTWTVPSMAQSDLIMRYEPHLQRTYQRDLNELHRLPELRLKSTDHARTARQTVIDLVESPAIGSETHFSQTNPSGIEISILPRSPGGR